MPRVPSRSSLPVATATPGTRFGVVLDRCRWLHGPGNPVMRGRQWRVTLRSAPLLGFLLFGKWNERVRIFRWKWLAEAEARRHKIMAGKDMLTETRIEPYVAGANVFPLPSRSAIADDPRDRG